MPICQLLPERLQHLHRGRHILPLKLQTQFLDADLTSILRWNADFRGTPVGICCIESPTMGPMLSDRQVSLRPPNEWERLERLRSYCVLDTPPEPMFDELTELASMLFGAPIVLVSLVDEHRQFFKSVVGLSATETHRDLSFCAYALLTDEPLIVPDATKDERFRDNALVTGEPYIRFYAGAPLIAEDGLKLGTFCIIDTQPRLDFTPKQYEALQRFATHTSRLLTQRLMPQRIASIEQENMRLEGRVRDVLESTSDIVIFLNNAKRIVYLSTNASQQFPIGQSAHGGTLSDLLAENPITGLDEMVQEAQRSRQSSRFEVHRERLNSTLEIHLCPTSEGLLLFIRDVSESRAMQMAIQRSEERFRQLACSTSEMVWFTSIAEPSEAGAKEWMDFTGQNFADMQECAWLQAVHPGDRERVGLRWQTAVKSAVAFEIEQRVRRKDGVYRRLRTRAFPVTDDGGSAIEWIGTYTDLTEREITDVDLCEANQRFVLATRATTKGIWDMDCVSGDVYYSARWRAIFGWDEQDVYGSIEDWFGRIHESDRERVRLVWQSVLASSDSSFQVEFRCYHEEGTWRWILVRANCRRNADGILLRVMGSASDITTQKIVDPLTGLHNRPSLLEQVQWRIDKEDEEPRSFGLFFIDIDSFKRINDSLGHRKGDALLVEIARRLEQTVEATPGSLVARLGGDEFVILLGDVAEEVDAVTYAASIDHLLKASFDCLGQKVFVSASIGVAFGCPGLYTEAEQMLEDADVAMYRAKLNGKAQNAVFSAKMREEARARLSLENDLRIAYQEDQFELFYQPKVRLPSGSLKGFEALIRWRHPKKGLVSPLEFIPVAEDIGLILDLGRWVAHTAIQQIATWRREASVPLETTIAINVSTRQFNELDFLDFLRAELGKADLPPQCLALEITESALLENSTGILSRLEDIAASGIGLDLDDFGTGYSSLSYLHRFPFRSVKIDRSFVARMGTDKKSAQLVSSIIALARSLNMSVIAEGVETNEQAELLYQFGCPAAQGYFFSPPKSVAEMDKILASLADSMQLPHS